MSITFFGSKIHNKKNVAKYLRSNRILNHRRNKSCNLVRIAQRGNGKSIIEYNGWFQQHQWLMSTTVIVIKMLHLSISHLPWTIESLTKMKMMVMMMLKTTRIMMVMAKTMTTMKTKHDNDDGDGSDVDDDNDLESELSWCCKKTDPSPLLNFPLPHSPTFKFFLTFPLHFHCPHLQNRPCTVKKITQWISQFSFFLLSPWPSSSCCGETWSLKILHHAFSFSLKTFYIIIIFLCFISVTKKPVLTFAQLLFQSSLKSWNIVSVLFVLFCTRNRERQNLFFWTLNWLIRKWFWNSQNGMQEQKLLKH